MTTITSSRELAAKAADEIERRGWYNGDLSNNESDPAGCKVCVLGATGAAYFNDPLAGYGRPRDEDGEYSGVRDDNYLNLIDEIGSAVVEGYAARFVRPVQRLYSWNDTDVADRDDPQSYIIGELRRFAESEAA